MSVAPLVLLHGVGADGRMFALVEERLADCTELVRWNLPGYGGSLLDGPLTFPGLANTLAADLDALAVGRPIVLGHSIGGMLALEYAATFPDRISGLILSATTPAFGSRDGSFQREFLKARLAPLDAGRSMAELAPEFAPRLVGSAAEPEAAATAARLMAELPEATFRAGLSCLVTFDRRADLANIRVPTLLIAGEEDTNAPLKTMTRMAESIPGARIEVLPRIGHLAPLECPDRYADIVRSFLTDLRQEGTA